MDISLLFFAVVAYQVKQGFAYNCYNKCSFNPHYIAEQTTEQDLLCGTYLPDNPLRNNSHIFPCQIHISTNCSNYCNVELSFKLFNLKECDKNLTHEENVCSLIDSCEYVILKEIGKDSLNNNLRDVISFHGSMTSNVYRSKTNKILLQYCYRSETFSARNIQIHYKAIDPFWKPPTDFAPGTVIGLCIMVVVMIVAIFVVRYAECLKPCLDPPPANNKYGYIDE